MKAAILDALGEIPRFGDFVEPDIRDNERSVRVTAAAIKPLDRAIATGTHYSSPKRLPVVCGMDGVGKLDDGSRAYFATFRRPFGTMAERAPAAWTVPVPDSLSDIQAAAIVNPALAAWLPLVWRGRLQPGETVLVMGATGAAGRFAVRAARLLGAGRVVAAGRRQEVLAGLEADATIDLRLPDDELEAAFTTEVARGIGVIIDYVWGRPIEVFLDTLIKSDLSAENSDRPVRLVSVGAMAGHTITLPAAALRASRLELIGSGTANVPPVDRMRTIVADILGHAADGRLDLPVITFSLANVAQAWMTAETSEERPVLLTG